ncbi:MAG: ABC transporter ATP-binding protein [Candidatus Aminicenantes bacterium]|nr:ABC transporter ATP-binding protein [Candidatus Aminicenantes bacterium]
MSELLKVAELGKSFGRRRVLTDVSFAVEPGRVYGFLGRNGEGKTTLARILMGIIPASRGEVLFKGKIVKFGDSEYKREIGYIPEDPFFYGGMKVGEFLRFNGSFYPRWNTARVRTFFETLDLNPGARIKTLSRGEKLQLGFVAAIGAAPDILILDDPTSGLDVPTRHDFLRNIIRDLAERGTAVLFATHMIHELERVADHLFILHGGRIILNRSFEDVKALTRRVRLWFDGEAPEKLPVEGVLSLHREAGRLEAVVFPWNGAAEEGIRSLSLIRTEIEPLSLEEIFVGFVGSGPARLDAK